MAPGNSGKDRAQAEWTGSSKAQQSWAQRKTTSDRRDRETEVSAPANSGSGYKPSANDTSRPSSSSSSRGYPSGGKKTYEKDPSLGSYDVNNRDQSGLPSMNTSSYNDYGGRGYSGGGRNHGGQYYDDQSRGGRRYDSDRRGPSHPSHRDGRNKHRDRYGDRSEDPGRHRGERWDRDRDRSDAYRPIQRDNRFGPEKQYDSPRDGRFQSPSSLRASPAPRPDYLKAPAPVEAKKVPAAVEAKTGQAASITPSDVTVSGPPTGSLKRVETSETTQAQENGLGINEINQDQGNNGASFASEMDVDVDDGDDAWLRSKKRSLPGVHRAIGGRLNKKARIIGHDEKPTATQPAKYASFLFALESPQLAHGLTPILDQMLSKSQKRRRRRKKSSGVGNSAQLGGRNTLPDRCQVNQDESKESLSEILTLQVASSAASPVTGPVSRFETTASATPALLPANGNASQSATPAIDNPSPASITAPADANAANLSTLKSMSPALIPVSDSVSPAAMPASNAPSPSDFKSPVSAPDSHNSFDKPNGTQHQINKKQNLKPVVESVEARGRVIEEVDPEDDIFGDHFVAAPVVQEFENLQAQRGIDDSDNAQGFYKVTIGEVLASRYLVKDILGSGTFAQVLRTYDKTEHMTVALKLFRKNDLLERMGRWEKKYLEYVADADREGTKSHIIRLYRDFRLQNHLCLVMENMDTSLADYIRKAGLKGLDDQVLPFPVIRTIARTIFSSLQFMLKHNWVHADIKPANILVNVANNDVKDVKLGDLGTFHHIEESHMENRNAGTPLYQPPELHLINKHDCSVDTWAVGCTLYQLFTGQTLFHDPADPHHMLQQIQEMRGPIGRRLLNDAEPALLFAYFTYDGSIWRFKNPETGNVQTFNTSGDHFIRTKIMNAYKLLVRTPGYPTTSLEEVQQFISLVDQCLQLAPDKRIKPIDALAHAFFKGVHA